MNSAAMMTKRETLGYPPVGTVEKTSTGTKTYTEQGYIFKAGNGYGAKNTDEDSE